MRSFKPTFVTMMRLAALAASCSVAMVGLTILLSEPSSADQQGDGCTLELKNGLKEPGTVDASGNCCSIFHANKCFKKSANGTYDEKKSGGSKGVSNPKKGVGGVTTVGGVKEAPGRSNGPKGSGTTTPPNKSSGENSIPAKK